ncbi:MAG: type II toxin-antitoxin system VapC family toxin [Pseudomonadota bacterium]
MFLDASVIVAILAREPGYEHIVKRIEEGDGPIFTSPMARFEAVVSFARAKSFGAKGVRPTPDEIDASAKVIDGFLASLRAREVSISEGVGKRAIEAARDYGKVVGHPADLNLGDCFAYACAKAYRLRLVYKGDDFSKTDLA